MAQLNIREIDDGLFMKLKIYAAEKGKTIKAVVEEWLTDLRAESSSARLSGVNPHERGSLPRVQQEAAVVFKGVDKLQHDAVRLSAIGKIFDEPREMVAIGAHGLKEVAPTADSLIAKVKGVKRASDLPPRNPKPAQDAFESPAVDREVIYEQD